MACGCNEQHLTVKQATAMKAYITGVKEISGMQIPVISTKIHTRDTISNWKVRWGIGRMNAIIQPGLYCVGAADENSPVIVTANYTLTFNKVREKLDGLNIWLLVLDTKGVNVWCAAGKGTFGTSELIIRIESTGLKKIVKHNTIILPQLGAPGVAAHIIKKQTGFTVKYGPVYIRDLSGYLNNNCRKTESMKRVFFTLPERLAVVPVDIILAMPKLLILLAGFAVYELVSTGSLSVQFLVEFTPFLVAGLSGLLFTPALLPFIPFRSFAIKGAILGALWSLAYSCISDHSLLQFIIYLLLLTPISSYTALNFTGASTYTSITGVKIEIKIATPLYIIFIISGVILSVLRFVRIV